MCEVELQVRALALAVGQASELKLPHHLVPPVRLHTEVRGACVDNRMAAVQAPVHDHAADADPSDLDLPEAHICMDHGEPLERGREVVHGSAAAEDDLTTCGTQSHAKLWQQAVGARHQAGVEAAECTH